VVLAAGTAAPQLLPALPIVPKKGHLAITDRYPGFLRHQVVELGYLKSAHAAARQSVACNLQPRSTGQVLIGSSRQLVGLDPSLDRAICAHMLARAIAYAPRLAELAVLRTWIGFRPATPDNLPYIGPWPEMRGLWIAAGHEGLGITTATGTARLLADLMTGRPPALDPRPYAPDRVLGTTATPRAAAAAPAPPGAEACS
jgi:glycine/D-amino acid oxidase-like deaminating enzyme